MKRKAHPHEHQGELNIVPYLDIMVNLVMFMLMSMSGFVSFQMINTVAPDLQADVAPPTDPSTPPPKPEENLVLNVSISKRGFYIAATGGVLPGQDPKAAEGADPETAPPTIALTKGTRFKEGKPVPGDVACGGPADCAKAGAGHACEAGVCMTYDYAALTTKMRQIKDLYQSRNQVFIAAEPAVKYDAIIGTMDATRKDAKGDLFPEVAFAAFGG